ncbi:DUF1569 domain-containing protein [Lentiprolixibacter aurantiacus]|uniref:DUF1569 domain-containing protein n=1 Tax=Lentiprolixibacter aurantiacus TaxID=2993939 RepID=A0AAE3SPH9_9FLAO|nr:DUF1569 domain-containing protein [Lentiprolixibacter aurantiacus]MCX2720704.1 DUF1569 domain-containing protein [Lentiprolixibacter aurantiacus]
MKSIFDEKTYQEVKSRMKALSPDSERQWGKMTVAQMLWHCQLPIRIAIKNKEPKRKSNPLIRLLFKKSLYNDKPWRKNLPTVKAAKATEEKDFEKEFRTLSEMITELHHLKGRENWNPHPIFGEFTPEQWGKLQYKHLDHHLKQFGV